MVSAKEGRFFGLGRDTKKEKSLDEKESRVADEIHFEIERALDRLRKREPLTPEYLRFLERQGVTTIVNGEVNTRKVK